MDRTRPRRRAGGRRGRAQQVEIKPAAKVKKDRYIITAEAIAERPEIRNGMEAVKLLRSQWPRPVSALVRLKYMTPTESSGRYGSGHEAGAILVTTTRPTGKP